MAGAIIVHGRQTPAAIAPAPQSYASPAGADGLASILIACAGQLEYTRLCVRSVLRHSRPPFELHFLDAGSLDGTTEYLAGIADAAAVRVEVVRVAGAPGESTAGQENVAVRGDFIVLLDNDTIVTPGWLDRLVRLARSDAALGMVAPMSNRAPPPLRVEQVPYRIRSRAAADDSAAALQEQVAELERFAAAFGERERGRSAPAERLGGGCALVKRAVLQQLGLFPTRNALGGFDLEALSERARQAGHRLAVCGDAFVHSFGSRRPG